MNDHIVIGVPKSVKQALADNRGAFTTDEIDAACVVMYGPCSWGAAISYHNIHGGLSMKHTYDHTMVRSVSDPRWAKLLDQVVTVKRHKGRKYTSDGAARQRQEDRVAKLVLKTLDARSLGGGWFDVPGRYNPRQGLWRWYKLAVNNRWVMQSGTDILVYTGRIQKPSLYSASENFEVLS